ncbi:LOW QUALITY PROTEIN: hypothetical protein RJ640_019346 [Escallonia rubra]|uniref:Uncharacterized protein n=1 Tax=Escallonia rubra TaxID=112253 RepID=A0AA88RRW1_9ASTE|nr:LOW QUALITY PROTEIN: hypothetical protein RJ640_019346 [Escallonia rubra]
MSIGHVMQTLRILDLSGNHLTGSIPSSVGKAEPLEYLSLSNNQLTGKIHDDWGSFQDLDTIDVSHNHFSGEIPISIFSLPWLSHLNVASNNLSGQLSLSLKNYTKLVLLDLALNRFTGNIPSWIGDSLTSLSVLRLRGNLFKGNIPQTLCDLSRLHILDLARNDLSGSIPACLDNLSGLRSLASYHQHPLPLLALPVIAMEVVTKGRELRYTLTLDLVNIIDFLSNNLMGEILEEITSLSTLGALNLSHNQLKGCIPHKVGGLHLLETLDLSSNHLSGQIPVTMTSMTSFNHLNLSWNNFSGPIPSANQFLTFNDPSIYEGNPQLCGSPLSTKCTTPDVGNDGDRKSIEGLGGQISPSLLDLKYLNYLDLSRNDFQGIPIPSFLGSLEQLTYLNLSLASFVGMVPPHLGNLSNLRHLDLSSFQDSWAADLYWLSGLSSLEYLNMDNVNISLATTHLLQAINMLPFLTELSLYSCQLTNLPPSLLPSSNLTSLSVLDLSDNNFNSFVPQWLFNISTLVDLELGYCSVKGLYPLVASGNFCGFRKLGLAGNDIGGEISEVVRNLAGCTENSLEELSLSSNRLSGQLPDSIGHFKKLRSISFGDNLITGPIPASVGELSNLESLDLSFNKMNGYLWQNHLQGLAKLKSFRISSSLSSRKALVLNISYDWVPPFNLTLIAISHCDVGPKFPAWLESQTQLRGIVLTDLAISDTIPHWLWKLSSNIETLDLSNNQLRGELPISLPFSAYWYVDLSFNRLEGPLRVGLMCRYLTWQITRSIPGSIGHVMQRLQVLDLSGNFLTGSIPSSLGKVKPLVFLFLSNNQLTGKIHDEWGSFQSLDTIDVSYNHFSGEIPTSICSLPLLSVLKVASNNLSGQLSMSLKNCTKLYLLDLGVNRFIGNIPSWIGESLTSLFVLRLRGNLFKGNIPQTLCNLSRLHILDLAQDDLSIRINPRMPGQFE